MKSLFIYDDVVVDLLIKNGFICTKVNYVQIITQSKGNIKDLRLYDTDCPVEVNTQYILPDKTIIQRCGTMLELPE